MTRSTTIVAPRLLDEAGQGPSVHGRPLVPSDPWTAGWAPPSEDDLARRHTRARRRERDLARQGWEGTDPVEDEPSPEPSSRPPRRKPKGWRRLPREPRPEPQPAPVDEERSPDTHTGFARRVLGGAAAVATAYWYFILATIVIAVAIPFASGWHASTVVTGSMEPVISPGDVVAFGDYDGSTLAVGTIIQFADPARPGQTVTHRVVGIDPDGSYITKGDANAANDSTPVPPESITGVAKIVAPNAGLPQMWIQRHQHLYLALWIVATIGAIAIMSAHSASERREPRPPRRSATKRSFLRPAMAVGLIAAVSGVGTAAWSQARFADAAVPAASTFQSASTFDDFSHDGTLGTVTCATNSSTITLTEPVSAGSTIIVRFALRDLRGGSGYSATDSAGNIYTVDAVASDGSRTEAAMLSAYVATALAAGDQITLTHPDGRATVATFDAFTGIAATNRVHAVATGSGNDWTPAITVTLTDVPVLAIGHIAVRDSVTVEAPAVGWDPLASGPVSCNRDLTHRAAYDQQDVLGAVVYSPTFDSKNRWSGVVVAYLTD